MDTAPFNNRELRPTDCIEIPCSQEGGISRGGGGRSRAGIGGLLVFSFLSMGIGFFP